MQYISILWKKHLETQILQAITFAKCMHRNLRFLWEKNNFFSRCVLGFLFYLDFNLTFTCTVGTVTEESIRRCVQQCSAQAALRTFLGKFPQSRAHTFLYSKQDNS